MIDDFSCRACGSSEGGINRECYICYKKRISNITINTSFTDLLLEHERLAANLMLQVVKRWLNTEPIEKEIWEDFNKLIKENKK